MVRDVSEFPFNRPRSLIVAADILHEFSFKIGDRGKDAPCNYIALDFRKPEFYLVEPRRICWRVVQLHLGMRLQELLDEFGFMSREVISNDMNLPPARLTGHEVSEEGDDS